MFVQIETHVPELFVLNKEANMMVPRDIFVGQVVGKLTLPGEL